VRPAGHRAPHWEELIAEDMEDVAMSERVADDEAQDSDEMCP
jgi:hypothetical protein